LSGAGVSVTFLIGLQDLYREGATASGLNPTGGGPGFLLILPPAIAGLVVGGVIRPTRSFRGGLIEGVLLGGAVWLVAWALTAISMPHDFPDVTPLVSTMGIAFFVSRMVVAAFDTHTPDVDGSASSGQSNADRGSALSSLGGAATSHGEGTN
jgi:Na+/proline symporter